ncbi:hypothetical protein L4D08_00320 [Photobacterium chitinilyticum]|uniref:hypothetical protein n=1 Tax=Photobacterium chitinilyticum TaxID=2485123 RepID=UPI003D13D2C3
MEFSWFGELVVAHLIPGVIVIKEDEYLAVSLKTQFFGNLVDFDCYIHDLLLILDKTESIDLGGQSDGLVYDCFPDVTRKSHIVTVLIVLEREFSTFCHDLKLATNQSLKWNDLKGSAIERFTKYCTLVCGIEAVIKPEYLQDVKGLIELRNCIVHNDSNLDGFSKSHTIKQLASRYEGIGIEGDYVSLSHDACVKLTVVAFKFLDGWYKAVLSHLEASH